MRIPIVASLLLIAALSPAAAIPYRNVALTGEPATGFADQVFKSLHAARINSSGEVGFSGRVTGGGGDFGADGIWVKKANASDSSRLAVARGQSLSNSSEQTYGRNEWDRIFDFTNDGYVVFNAGVQPSGSYGLFSEFDGVASTIAQEGLEAPQLPGVLIGDLFNNNFAAGPNGTTLFSGQIDNSVRYLSDTVLWEYDGISSSIKLRVGDPAPTAPDYTIASIRTPRTNRHGDFSAVVGHRVPGPNPFSPRTVSTLLVEQDGIWESIAKSGDIAPGTSNALFSGISTRYLFNDLGQVAFDNFLAGEGVPDERKYGIWIGDHNELELVVQLGDQAPGIDGVRFARHRSGSAALKITDLNDQGDVSFQAVLDGEKLSQDNLGSVWKKSDGDLILVVLQGDLAPGTEHTFTSVSGGLMNNAGQVVIRGYYGSVEFDRSNRFGIWATSPQGELRLIVKEGDVINTRSSDNYVTRKIVESVSYAAALNSANAATAFNDLGELVVTLGFTDGTEGIFVFNTAIPEPSTGCLLGLLVLARATVRRRR